MNWYQVVLLLVTTVCIGAPMLYVFGIKEKEMHPNVKEIQNVQALRLENAKLRLDNAKLRKRMELLTTILHNDFDIDASWDGLRLFWSIELTDGGCLMRDRACKAEAENDKLRKAARDAWLLFVRFGAVHPYNLPEVDRVRESLQELGIEVKS